MKRTILLILVIVALSCHKDRFNVGSINDVKMLPEETANVSQGYIKHNDFKVSGAYRNGDIVIWKLKNENYVIVIIQVPLQYFDRYNVGDIVPSDEIYTIMGWEWRAI